MKKILVFLLSLLLLLPSVVSFTGCDAGDDGGANGIYQMVDENTIKFGKYPQTKVKDDQTITALLEKSGNPLEDTSGWTSYGYLVRSEVSDCMYYKDVELNGEKYRGVYIKTYRPYRGDMSSTTSTGQTQYDYGYYASSVHWFKYEWIEWTILEQSNGVAFLFSNLALDAQEFNLRNNHSHNRYKESTIRQWLNQTFYDTAFDTVSKNIIQTTEVDNSAETTLHNPNEYASENTFDKVFLLSCKEATNSSYGFNEVAYSNDEFRQKGFTDYAKSQGCPSESKKASWCLRSPDNVRTYVRCVDHRGNLDALTDYFCYKGVVPALKIKL